VFAAVTDEQLLTNILKYCQMFGNKPCCYKDLFKYFDTLLSIYPAEELLDKVWTSLEVGTDGISNDCVLHCSDVSIDIVRVDIV